MKIVSAFALLCILALPVAANPAFDHQHTLFDRVLKQVVVFKGEQSYVDYQQLQQRPGLLQQYTEQLEQVSQHQFDGWSEPQQLAFLINAYNAWTLELILTGYPEIDSIKDLGGFFSSPWKKAFFNLFGETQTLDHIEHGLLRVNYQEPRIHFAIVCASIGCPPLQRFAYTPNQLDVQLTQVTRAFLRDASKNRYNPSRDRLELSSIFDWFAEDFERKGSVAAYVAPWITDDPVLENRLRSQKIKIIYRNYDWALNSLPQGQSMD